jgi:hypothetical protein
MINLFPKDEVFYTLFEKQAEKLTEAAKLLDELLKNPQNLEEVFLKMKKLEEEADDLGHNVIDNLRKTFITPIEGEDIDLLRQYLDNIMDRIERVVNRMRIYKIQIPFPKEIKEYIEVIKKAIEEINLGVKEIRNVNKFQENLHSCCQKLNELENVGDEINRTALRDLMSPSQITPERNLEIMKLKEIYETLEEAIDFCEDVGNIFESILIKNR